MMILRAIWILGFLFLFCDAQITSYGIKMGMQFNKVSDSDSLDLMMENGAQVGLHAHYSFLPWLGLQPEISLLVKPYQNVSVKNEIAYMEFPLLLNFKFSGINLLAGPSYNTILSSPNLRFGKTRPYIQSEYIDYTSFIAGINKQFNVNSQLITIEVKYSYGITGLFKNVDNKMSTFSLNIGLGANSNPVLSDEDPVDLLKKKILRESRYIMNDDQIEYFYALTDVEEINSYMDDLWEEKRSN
jgi:hypothetical protein